MLEHLSEKRKRPVAVTVIAAAVCVCIGLIFYSLFSRYEDGMIDIYAQQQDGYVELVHDQINLQKEDTSQEIVTDILATLDASDSRYWTFSDDGTIVFVKNVLETQNYESVSMQQYFADLGNAEYLQTLRENEVTHQILTLDGERYIASGVLFQYGQKNYQLVLLTSVRMILENNVFLEAKTEIYAVLVTVLMAVFLYITTQTLAYNRVYDSWQSEKMAAEKLRKSQEKKNQDLLKEDILDSRGNIFPVSSLKHALEELSKRSDAFPLSLTLYCYETGKERNTYLDDLQRWISSTDILFDDEERNRIIILTMKKDVRKDEAMQALIRKYQKIRVTVYDSVERLQEDLKQ